ncbi:MAG: hypothetical protein R3268_03820, partial [Acidiferrobacterales bacterium]|nr:hypothetical protein [Acidiferrobacterales bacterium]
NERYGETGMQSTHTHFGIDLAGIARAAGFPHSTCVYADDELRALIPTLYSDSGPTFAVVKVMARTYATVLPARDGTYLKNRFRAAVLEDKAAK